MDTKTKTSNFRVLMKQSVETLRRKVHLKKPILIAGPCSAESPKQLDQTAKAISKIPGITALRAGIWKPRTRPNSFEGVGEEALPWLVETGKRYNLATLTEVANPNHVELALKAGIDMLWLGARTTANPFSVQAIAESLQGVSIPVLIKNPIHLDLQLWIGAIERFQKAGHEQIAAIHRGFAIGNRNRFRNQPLWEIAIELKRTFPTLPLINDPSHITGNRTDILAVSQKALDLNFDGLIIETHIDPDHAWSDSNQQITPKKLEEILSNLQFRNSTSPDPEYVDNLQTLRHEIDLIDEELLHLLKTRIEKVKQIGTHKLKNNVTVFQLERWLDILKTRGDLSEELGMNRSYISEILKSIHNESIRLQTLLQKKDE
jgi:chorismate mutase